MRVKLFTICTMLIICYASCETWDYRNLDELNYGSSELAIDLFVEGGITTQMAYHKLLLSKPGNYADNSEAEAISEAEIYIVSSTDEIIQMIAIDTVYTPYYITKERVKAEVGKSYTLHIDYKGKHYTATDSVIKALAFDYENILLPVRNNSQIFPDDTVEYISLSIAKHDFGYPQSNAWSWIEKPVFSDSLNYNDMSYFKVYTHWRADVQGVFSNVNYYYSFGGYHLTPNDTLVTVEYSLSDNYYDYSRAKFMETDWKEGYFSSQSGNLPTNFSSGAAGYFYTSDCLLKEITVKELLKLTEE